MATKRKSKIGAREAVNSQLLQISSTKSAERFAGTRILLIFDESNFPGLENDAPLYLKFSHDLNLAQFAQAAMDTGAEVFVSTSTGVFDQSRMWRVRQFHPLVQRDLDPVPLEPNFSIVASCAPEALLVKERFPGAKIVAFFAAVHFIESPGLHDRTWLYKIALALRLHVDYVVTQHTRMGELIRLLGMLTGSVDLSERIISCPLGLWQVPEDDRSTRLARKYELALGGKVVIGNAGGVWRWTDFKTFLTAYIMAVRAGSDRLKLCITGLTQPNNADHAEHSAEIRRILAQNADLVSDRTDTPHPITFVDDWTEGGKLLRKLLPALDFGLNLNLDLVEGWQSYRVRVLDYLSHNIAILSTEGDWLSDDLGRSRFLRVRPQDTAAYYRTLLAIQFGEVDVEDLRASQRQLAIDLHYASRYRKLLDSLLAGTTRTNKNPAELDPCMYDIAALDGRRELEWQFEKSLENLTHSFLNSL